MDVVDSARDKMPKAFSTQMLLVWMKVEREDLLGKRVRKGVRRYGLGEFPAQDPGLA
jgi:hypothetical protein